MLEIMIFWDLKAKNRRKIQFRRLCEFMIIRFQRRVLILRKVLRAAPPSMKV